MKIILYILILLFIYINLDCQDVFYNIYNYTSREIGLNMSGFEIVQDKAGTLWMRDYTNIGAYNGKIFENKTRQLEKVAGKTIEVFDIYADGVGKIWISCSGGVYKYDNIYGFEKFIIRGLKSEEENGVTSIIQSEINEFVIGTATGNLHFIDKLSGKLKKTISIADKPIIKYINITNGNIYLSTNNGIYKISDQDFVKKIYNFTKNSQNEIYADNRHQKIQKLKNGQLVANDNNDNLIFFDIHGNFLKKVNFRCKSTEKHISDWIELDDNILMCATYDGIYNYNLKTGNFSKKSNDYLLKNQLFDTYLISICKTRNNELIFGASTCISKLNFLNEQFINVNIFFPSKTLLIKEINSKNEQWLVVTEKNGILLFDRKYFRLKKLDWIKDQPIEYVIYDEKNDELSLALKDKILILSASNNGKVLHQVYKSGFVTGMTRYENELWFVADLQLNCYNSKTGKSKKINFSSKLIDVIHDRQGNLYASGTDFYKLTDDKLENISKNSDNFDIIDLAIDNENYIYFTYNRSICQYNPKTNTIESYDQKFGLPNEFFTYLESDNAGYIWACTKSSGLCRFDTKTKTCRCFKEQDGLVDNIYLFGLSRVKNGVIAGHRWQFFSYYDPKKQIKSISLSEILLKNILINNIDKTKEVLQQNEIKLKSANSLINFDLDFPVYTDPSNYRIFYRLKKSEDALWSEMGDDHKIIINNIDPGKYTLELKVENLMIDGDIAFKQIKLLADSPFYMKWWFFAMCTFLSYIIIYLVLRYKHFERKKYEILRHNISKDLHDEMGSNLSSVMLLGELALVKDNPDKKTIKKMVDKTKDIMRSMSDIVWSINPGNDNLPSIIMKIENTCVEILEPLGINLQFKIDKKLNDLQMDMKKRQAFYMIFKEAVNNCAKYSNAKNVSLIFWLDNNTVFASLQDDGCGFDLENYKKGNGLENIKTRANQISGKASIFSSLGEGTKIVIEFPMK